MFAAEVARVVSPELGGEVGGGGEDGICGGKGGVSKVFITGHTGRNGGVRPQGREAST